MKKYLLLGLLIIFFSGLLLFSYFGSDKYKELSNKIYKDLEKNGVVGVDGSVNLVEIKSKRDNLLDEIVLLYEVEYNYDNYRNIIERIKKDNTNLSNEVDLLSSEITVLEQEKDSLKKQQNVLKKKYDGLVYSRSSTVSSNNSYNFPLINQNNRYPTGCESVSLTMLLKYYGVNVSVDDVINRLKKGDLPYYEGGVKYGGNPEVEFIGSPYSSSSYGVYEKPIAEVANSFKSGINIRNNFSFSEVINVVSSGKPVMVWTSIGLSLPYISTSWIYKPTMETIYWKANEHAVVIIGIEGENVVIADPIGGKIKRYSKSLFEERYNYYGKKALYY